jgi:hypothetical protein
MSLTEEQLRRYTLRYGRGATSSAAMPHTPWRSVPASSRRPAVL